MSGANERPLGPRRNSGSRGPVQATTSKLQNRRVSETIRPTSGLKNSTRPPSRCLRSEINANRLARPKEVCKRLSSSFGPSRSWPEIEVGRQLQTSNQPTIPLAPAGLQRTSGLLVPVAPLGPPVDHFQAPAIAVHFVEKTPGPGVDQCGQKSSNPQRCRHPIRRCRVHPQAKASGGITPSVFPASSPY